MKIGIEKRYGSTDILPLFDSFNLSLFVNSKNISVYKIIKVFLPFR